MMDLAEMKRQRNREAQAAKNAKTKALYSDAQQALDELRAETERARAARFGTKRFASLAATPDIPAANAARGDQLTGAAGACNHGVGIGLIGVGI